MAIQSVAATICGKRVTLSYNPETGLYEYSGAAPQGSSFPLAGGYYPVSIEARTDRGERAQADDQTPGLGEALRLFVKETGAPTVEIVSPADKEIVKTSRPEILVRLRDYNSGINLSAFLYIDNLPYSLEDPRMTVTPVPGGYDLIFVPQLEPRLEYYTVLVNCHDNDGNESSDMIMFRVDFSGLPVHTDALCAKRLPGWKAEVSPRYQINLLEPVYQAEIIRRCHCV